MSWMMEKGNDESQSQPQEHLQKCGALAYLTDPHGILKGLLFRAYVWPSP